MEKFIDKIEHYPQTCLLEVCYKCNLSCKHCGSSLNTYGYDRGNQLSLVEFKKVIQDIKELGGEHLVLTGGEAVLYEHWEELAIFANGLGFRVSLISNGYIMDDNLARRIKSSGIKLVALSLDGTREEHNFMRNNHLAYDKVVEASRHLKNHGLQVNFITTVTSKNIGSLREIEDIVSDLNCDYWQLQIGTPIGQLAKHYDLVLPPSSIVKVIHFILEAKKRKLVKITTSDSIGYFSDDELELRNNYKNDKPRCFLGCFAGCLAVSIESNGNVKGCLSLQDDKFIEGNIRNESIKDIWNRKGSFSYTRDFDINNLKGHCKDCKYGNICRGGCTCLSYSATGSLHNNPYCMQHFINE